MMSKPRLLQLHRWLGVFIGAFIFIQAVSGVLLVFREEIETIVHPSLTVAGEGPLTPVQTMLDNAKSSFPDYAVSRLLFPEKENGAVIARLEHNQSKSLYLVALNPYSGEVIRHGGLAQWPMECLFRVHYELLSGAPGRKVVGLFGLALLFFVGSGLIVWWPGLKRIPAKLSVPLNKGADRALRGLHRSAGAVASLWLIIAAATGALIIWKAELRKVLDWIGPFAEKPSPVLRDIGTWTAAPIDDLIARAKRDYGDTHLQQLRFPRSDGRIVIVFLDAPQSRRPNASKQIWYDVGTGDNLGHYLMGETPTANAFVDWLLPVHSGKFFGVASKALAFLGGVCLIGLSASGIWMWWSRTSTLRRRRKVRAGQ